VYLLTARNVFLTRYGEAGEFSTCEDDFFEERAHRGLMLDMIPSSRRPEKSGTFDRIIE